MFFYWEKYVRKSIKYSFLFGRLFDLFVSNRQLTCRTGLVRSVTKEKCKSAEMELCQVEQKRRLVDGTKSWLFEMLGESVEMTETERMLNGRREDEDVWSK